jgi:hypothetical protein
MRKVSANIVLGILLVLVGSYLLAAQFLPQIKFWESFDFPRSAWLVVIGGGLLLLGLLNNRPGLAVPATILAGIGGILWYQEVTGDWESWAYLWGLIPGFIGVGILIKGLLEGSMRAQLGSALWLIVISLVLVTIIGGFWGAELIKKYWPIALIAIGVLTLLQPLLKRR